MKSYSERITVGSPLALSIPGKTLYIQRSSAGPVLNVEIVKGQAESSRIARVGKGFKVTPATGFDGIRITTTADSLVDFVVTDGGIDLAFDEDAQIIGNEDDQAIPIRTPAGKPLEVLFGGTVEPVLGIATVDNNDDEAIPVRSQSLSIFMHAAPVSVGVTATVLTAADATRRKLVIRNGHVSAAVAIGGASITMENAAIVLLPGDIWEERDAAGAAWYAISDESQVSVQVMGLR